MQSPFGRCANDLVPRLGSCSSRPTIGGLASASALTASSMSEKSQGGSSAPGLAWPQAAQVLLSGWLISVQAGQVQSPADRSAIGPCAGRAGAEAAGRGRTAAGGPRRGISWGHTSLGRVRKYVLCVGGDYMRYVRLFEVV